MLKDDYCLTIEEVSKRLNKSIRTIHRYKNSGRLSFIVGTTQGNPLFFSKVEVEELAKELYPNMAPVAPPESAFWERLERVERMLTMFERNPFLERITGLAKQSKDHTDNGILDTALARLAEMERQGGNLDRRELGLALIQLGNALLKG